MSCVYLGDPVPGKSSKDGRPVHTCQIHNLCTTGQNSHPTKDEFANCLRCTHSLARTDDRFPELFTDHLRITGPDKKDTSVLRNMLKMTGVGFILGGGPSANDVPLEDLHKPGCWSMAVNNMAGHFRSNAFVCSDPPSKFHTGIWLDPAIMKFVPIPKLSKSRGKIRRKLTDGTFEHAGFSACDCPNVWGFLRNSWLTPDESFFLSDGACWGNLDAGVLKTGEPKTVCTLLLALRICYYLGLRRIYLVGVDFRMDPARAVDARYAFRQDRDEDATRSNNSQFRIANDWLCRLHNDGVFRQFGLEIYNCNEMSGLRAFEYVPFEEAVADAIERCPQRPYDLAGWYEKGK